jgi:hypothetical protein
MKHQGPSLKIINTCYNCEFFEINLNGVKCNKLEKWLSEDYNRYVRPHELCPFLKSEKEMLENKLAEIEVMETKQLEKLIINIFSGYDYSTDDYSGGISLKVKSSIYSTSYSEFKEKLPDYEFAIDSYDSDTMQITVFKKAKNK